MIQRALYTFLTLSTLFMSSVAVNCQVATGLPAFGTFQGGLFDTTNLGNLNVHITIPILHKAGRGLPFIYDLEYDSSVWSPSGGSWAPAFNWGWHTSFTDNTGYVTFRSTSVRCVEGGGSYAVLSGWTYFDPWGIRHAFPGSFVTPSPCSTQQNPFPITATDGSGLTFSSYNFVTKRATITTRGGATMNPPLNPPPGSSPTSTTFTDSNGNQIASNSSGVFTDTLGQPALTISGSAPSPTTFTYVGPTGSGVPVTISYTPYNIKTNFACSGIAEYTATSVYLVGSITLGDGSHYAFSYEPTIGISGYYTGRLKSVTLPSGGSITYTYSGGNNGVVCADGSTAGMTRQISTGGSWVYSRAGSGSTWNTTISDPLSNQTIINFSKDTASTNPTNNLYETQRQIYQGPSSGGTLLLTALRCYNGNYASCSTHAVASPISQIDKYRIVPFGSTTKTALSEVSYNSVGLTLEDKEYDYGVTVGSAPSSAFLVSDTTIIYASLGAVVDRPSQVKVTDGTGLTVKFSTSYGYDETAVTPTSGTPQHVAVTGARGNQTTVTATTGSGAPLVKHFAYYDTGNVYTATDVNGSVLTYVYGACGNSFVTEIDLPLSLQRHLTWDTPTCSGAVVTSTTDENGNSTAYLYQDSNYWRATSVQYPDGGGTRLTYNDGTASPWNIIATSNKDATSTISSKSILDAFGRQLQQQITSDSSGVEYVDTTYDTIGRIASVSNAYRTTSDPTYGVTQYAYDALDRLTSVTNQDISTATYTYTGAAVAAQDEGYNSQGTLKSAKIYQNDGLGRLKSICEVSSATLEGSSGSPAACGQDTAATGFLTAYQYDTLGNITSVSQPGVGSRTYVYDRLSRVTQAVTPESGATTYTYDSATAGDLYQRTRPKQNQSGAGTVVTTYAFDPLHRLTSTSYNDGVTPGATFNYDQASINGNVLSNGKARLTYAVAGTGSASTIFSYDTMGRISQEWQCTPLNCGSGTFSLQTGHDYLGNVTQMTNGAEGVTYTYAYDTVGRLANVHSSLSDSNHPSTLFMVNSYNALDMIQQATLGNGIVRNVAYDDRGRVTTQSDGSVYSVGLGYAPNGNIITANDSINGNWTYTMDSLGHIASSSSTGGAFTYNYDPAGNRWKQSGNGPSPQYAFDANNHMIGYSYDAAGNLLSDTFHNYTYDAEGRLLTVDNNVAYSYDAFGQRVRSIVGGQTQDFIFDQDGHSIDALSGGVLVRSELYAGGIHVGTYANSTTYFEHSDWIGTVRARSGVNGAGIEACTSLPFGDNQNCSGTDASPLHFADLQWDSESNLQHAPFRQYSTTEGRWTTPDPIGLGGIDIAEPQSWNLYSYVSNNPCSFEDPLGLYKCEISVGIVFPNSTSAAVQKSIESALQNLMGPDVGLRFNVGGVGDVNINIGINITPPGVVRSDGAVGDTPMNNLGEPFNYGFVDVGQVLDIQNFRFPGRTNSLAGAIATVAAHELGHELYLGHNELGGIMSPAGDPFLPLQFSAAEKINLLNTCEYMKRKRGGVHPPGKTGAANVPPIPFSEFDTLVFWREGGIGYIPVWNSVLTKIPHPNQPLVFE